nr:hypothetical protein BaRGS_027872 [Batillaria attramentaria]
MKAQEEEQAEAKVQPKKTMTSAELDAVMVGLEAGLDLALQRAKAWSRYTRDIISYIEKKSQLGCWAGVFCLVKEFVSAELLSKIREQIHLCDQVIKINKYRSPVRAWGQTGQPLPQAGGSDTDSASGSTRSHESSPSSSPHNILRRQIVSSQSLDELTEEDMDKMPVYSYRAFECLQGIYRVSGVKSKVESLCRRFDLNPELVDLEEVHPNIISNVLKLYLRQLPEPLLTFRLYADFIHLAKVSKADLKVTMDFKCLISEGNKFQITGTNVQKNGHLLFIFAY